MNERNLIIEEVLKRLWTVGPTSVDRNPGSPPTNLDSNSLYLQVFELEDKITQISGRAPHCTNYRELTIEIDSIMESPTEEYSHVVLFYNLGNIRSAIFSGRRYLDGKCSSIIDGGFTSIFRPPIGNFSIGIGWIIKITYIETLT